MPHVFDTGLAKPQRTLILEGVVAALAGLKKTAGLYLEAVESFGGVIRSYADEEGIAELELLLAGRAPAVAISLGDRTAGSAGAGGHKHFDDVEMLIYFYSRHPRGLLAGRQIQDAISVAANTADPGLHVMFEHVEELLVGTRLANTPTIKQCRLTREVEVRTRNGFTLWCQHYAIGVDRQVIEFRSVTQKLAEIRASIKATPSLELAATQSLTLEGVAKDATSQKRAPLTLVEWGAFIGGLAPRHSWGFQDLAGNVAATIGSALTATGALEYQQAVTGWTRKAIRISPTAGERATLAAGAGGVDPGAGAVAWFALIDFLATPGAPATVIMVGSGLEVRLSATPRLELVVAGQAAAGTQNPVTGGVRPVLVVYRRSHGTVTLYTDQEIIRGTYSPTVVGGERGFGSTGTPADVAILLGAALELDAAELGDDDARSLFEGAGFAISW